MSDGSPIGWLNQPGFGPMTSNVVMGCTPRSDGCALCFAPRSVVRQAHLEGRDGIVVKNPDGTLGWTGKVVTFPGRLPGLVALRSPRMIFVTVLGDLFDPQVSMDFLIQLWETMQASPQHIYVIFSKLAKRMHDAVHQLVKRFGVLRNVWLGVSIEDQHQTNIRVPWLLRTPAAIRVVSCEPLLGPIDLRSIPFRGDTDYLIDPLHRRYRSPGQPATDGWGTTPFHSGMANLGGIDWVIVGGESGPKDKVRPMHPAWARDLIKQAEEARVARFFKQWGNFGPAPWVVKLPDDIERTFAAAGATGGPAAANAVLAAAKTVAEKIGATHYYSPLAHLHGWKLGEAGHKPWSGERHELAPGEPNAPMRFYPNTSAGHLLDGRTIQQWPSVDGRIIEAKQPVEERV